MGVIRPVPLPQRAAAVVNVIGVAVVGVVDGDDRLQFLRSPGSDLDRIKATIRGTPETNVAIAPRLTRKPCNRLDGVRLLLLRILVRGITHRRTGTTDVKRDRGDA